MIFSLGEVCGFIPLTVASSLVLTFGLADKGMDEQEIASGMKAEWEYVARGKPIGGRYRY